MTPSGWLELAYVVHLLLLPAAPHTVHSWTGTTFKVLLGPELNKHSVTLKEDVFVCTYERRSNDRPSLNAVMG